MSHETVYGNKHSTPYEGLEAYLSIPILLSLVTENFILIESGFS